MRRCSTYAALAVSTYDNGFIIKGDAVRADPVIAGTRYYGWRGEPRCRYLDISNRQQRIQICK